MAALVAFAAALALLAAGTVAGSDTNHVYQPCADTKVQRSDGFTFGLVFSRKDNFYWNGTQLTPCDHRLPVNSDGSARTVVFRPKVDEISLLSVNSSSSQFSGTGGYMVAFAGRKYAARSLPIFVADNTYIVTSFTLVLEFHKGTLQNLYWKRGCKSCEAGFKCINNNQDCGIRLDACNGNKSGCNSLNIQVAFSGTDKHLAVLNSWYEVSSLRQYSLLKLYTDLKSYF